MRLRQMAAVSAVVRTGRMGRHSGGLSVTQAFETEAASTLRTRHALAVNSGTSALVCALVGVGVGPGDEVLVPAYTWVSTAAAPLALGAVPVLVEVDETLTIDVEDLERKITPRTRAIIPVHMVNVVADMAAIREVADRHGLKVVEDACQAFGVTYRGQRVGTIGDAGAYSFSHTKNISAGEGGLVVTDDDRAAARAQMFHDVGSYTRASWTPGTEPLFVGMNLKMSELTSAVLRPQLRRLDARLDRMRRRRAAVIEVLSADPRIRVSPHHDAGSAVGLTVVFDDPADAERFARARGVTRLIDTERHVFVHWESIRGRRTFDGRFDPWGGAADPGAPDRAPRTLDVLARTCRIALRDDLPTAAMRLAARRMLDALREPATADATVGQPRVPETQRG